MEYVGEKSGKVWEKSDKIEVKWVVKKLLGSVKKVAWGVCIEVRPHAYNKTYEAEYENAGAEGVYKLESVVEVGVWKSICHVKCCRWEYLVWKAVKREWKDTKVWVNADP